jgi:hypothetical protein
VVVKAGAQGNNLKEKAILCWHAIIMLKAPTFTIRHCQKTYTVPLCTEIQKSTQKTWNLTFLWDILLCITVYVFLIQADLHSIPYIEMTL